MAVAAARHTLKKKAGDLIVLELKGLTVVTDYFLICSAESTTQVKAITDHVVQELSATGIHPRGIEGLDYSHWVLIDYGDVIIHIFEKETRRFYDLEKLWMDAPLVELNESTDHMGGKNKRAVRT